ncbi:aldehyde dehydrogenase (NADP(+)) [Kangiella sp. HZ709]|uniref:aldehyde dehydrogenase (NADP(+)) n=1 Tax=Kangiella sp. HZ709 TaxID=2666328 RepID=UPI0012AEEE72|nr:aldehyde dehydrogenase (NADP(+)) [Kangiella sp. HZ709]MRX28580.1 aldehyde dehydrogenase family protein [Kangiella sp. HZ709]
MIIGKHLIAGKWKTCTSSNSFSVQHLNGESHQFPNASKKIVDDAVNAASVAFKSYGQTNSKQRASFLRAISTELETFTKKIIAVCQQESGLPEARLIGEMARTRSQLEMFASHIEKGTYLDRQHDIALPDRQPLPRPDIKRVMRPFGPVAIFGASNFPLAFSTAGGDTASALAAGCPVIVKGHPAHPATSDLVAQAILNAINKSGLDLGVFSLIHDSSHEAAQHLVKHPEITAAGFTGSIKGGRALFDLCAQRPNPIPFYAEMGSLNPLFVLPNAVDSSAEEIAKNWASSMTMGAGQFCTKPGLLILPTGKSGDEFVTTAITELQKMTSTTMLTEDIASAFSKNSQAVIDDDNIENILINQFYKREALPQIFSCNAKSWLNNSKLQEEVFGPLGVIVRTSSPEEMILIAEQLNGQLTATLHLEQDDFTQAKTLIRILENKAGRILVNGFPTGVEVADSMVHGGPYPASTYMSTTSVGSHAIQRFLKPVCYQNMPEELLPEELR